MDDLAAEDSPGSDHRYDDDEYRYTNEDCVALLCLYCRLPFQRGDWVIARSYVGPALTQPFRWYPYMRFYEEEFDSLLSPCMCDGEDNDNDHQLSSCHVTCHQFAAVNCPALHMTPELNRAVVHSADPPPSHDAQRFAWLRDSAAHCIHAQFSTLPLEICLEIAGYLVPEYAVLLQASYWQNASSCTCTVTTTSDIWARYISIDGTRLVLAIQAALPAGVIGMRIHDGQQMEFEFDGLKLRGKSGEPNTLQTMQWIEQASKRKYWASHMYACLLAMSSNTPNIEDEQVFFFDPPLQPPSQCHPAMDPNAGQMSYAPAASVPPAFAWPPVTAPEPLAGSQYGQHSPLPLHPMHSLDEPPAEHHMTRQYQLPGHAEALPAIPIQVSRKTRRVTPSPPSSKRIRLALSPDRCPSESRYVPFQPSRDVKASPNAAASPPNPASKSTQPSLRVPRLSPSSPGDGAGTRSRKTAVYVSPSAALLRARTQPGFQNNSIPRPPSPEPTPLVATEPVFSHEQPPPPICTQQAPHHGEPLPSPPPATVEPNLCPEQAALVDLICSGRNVFYTGSAGCGKSTVLKAFTKRLRDMGKKVHVVAPTGRAALQVNGSTTWTYAGWTPDSHKKPLQELQNNAHGKFVWKRFKKTDVLVIDEISMVENLHFERLNKILQHALYNPNLSVQKAFGGIQIVVTGDFCQLPPVRPFEHCMECGKQLSKRYYQGELSYACHNPHHPVWRDEDKWAFASDAWQQCSFVHVNLKEIHRQKAGKFTEILNKCRIGLALTESDKQLLINHECQVTNATKLFATREEVAQVNQQQFKKLISLEHTFWTRDTFRWQEKHPHLRWKGDRKEIGPTNHRPLQALDDHRFDQCVKLKQGMLVVLLVNLNLSQGLCNGSQGIVCGFERYDKDKLPKAVKRGKNDEVLPQDGSVIYGDYAHIKEAEIKSYIETKGPAITFQVWPKVRFHNGQTRVIHAECSINELGDDAPYSLISRTQIPLAPAWAMTIHKSQSLTLDRVIVNLSRAFEVGQVYVALSRATGLEGLKIEGDVEGLEAGIGGNPKVQRFLRQHFGALNGPGFKNMKHLAPGSSEPA
ncbi:ATP-dependent DNA helicase PIF1 [Apiospora arundinis]|uniref:ATP-dependent DNA helicase n=1 Tax=Apiospora arundinis TaxID=335852 RepID=A0ABR2J678_9PEZI